jgi:hypothetical protein
VPGVNGTGKKTRIAMNGLRLWGSISKQQPDPGMETSDGTAGSREQQTSDFAIQHCSAPASHRGCGVPCTRMEQVHFFFLETVAVLAGGMQSHMRKLKTDLGHMYPIYTKHI